jgi:excisionase family DNA binding protein
MHRNTSDPGPCPVYPNRKGRNARLRELDLKALPYVPLPRAPLRWEARSGGPVQPLEAQDSFEIRDAKWRLTAVKKLPTAERPDPAARGHGKGAGRPRAKRSPTVPPAELESDMMTLDEVAEYLNCSYATVLLRVMRNGLLVFRLGDAGDGWWVRRSDLEKWIAENQVRPAGSGPKARKQSGPRRSRLRARDSAANFLLATTERFKDRVAHGRNAPKWHRIVVFGKLANTCAQYLSKGRQVYVEGRLTTREYEANDGIGKRCRTEIVARRVRFLSWRGDAAG